MTPPAAFDGAKHMSIDEIRRRTPCTERYVNGWLRIYAQVALPYRENRIAYKWRMRELRYPRLIKLFDFFHLVR